MTTLREDEPLDMTALLRVDQIAGDRHTHEVHEVMAETHRRIPVASAQQANVLAQIRASLADSLDPAMRQAIAILAANTHGQRYN